MASLFMSITNGIDWHDVAAPLLELDFIWATVFTCFITFVIFAVLNVVTAIFCQSAVEAVQWSQDAMMDSFMKNKEVYTARFKQLFRRIDTENNGFISKNDFKARCADKNVENYFATLQLESFDAMVLFKVLDV